MIVLHKIMTILTVSYPVRLFNVEVATLSALTIPLSHVSRLLRGEVGTAPLDAREYEQSRSLVAALVPRGSAPGQLDMEARFTEPERRVMAPAVRYALLAAEEAVSQAGWTPLTDEQQVSAPCGTGYGVGMGRRGWRCGI